MMEFSLFYASLALFFIIVILKFYNRKHYRLPPSPAPALPLIGHLHLLTPPLHRTFRRFSQTLGPIFSLKVGSRRIVVVSSRHLVEECFTKNDIVFSNRPRSVADDCTGYNFTTLIGAPYGHHWRGLRRLAAEEVLASNRLNALSELRQDEMRRTLQDLITNCEDFTVVELRPKIFQLIFNVIMRMLAGKPYFSGESDDEKLGKQIFELESEIFECAQSSNLQNILPFLNWIDYGGLKKKLARLGKELDGIYERLLAEHRREKKNTVIGHLLSLQESKPEFYSDQTIKGFISNMILAGTDTSIVTVEWAMSLLLNHPNSLQKAKSELDLKIGHQRLVEEQDLPNLTYLQNIILETFRMFPAGPLLVPRASFGDCTVGGYDIPSETILLVNAWAIHRDPNVWDEPTLFKPERFEGKQLDTDKMLPFGLGRRACPAASLGQRMVGLALAMLIQCFDWESVGPDGVDLTEGGGLAMAKLEPLEAMCRPRQIMLAALQESNYLT